MTVCVGVAVNDCLVFAADSASTLVAPDPKTGESRVLNVYQHGDKVFNLFKRLPVCAMTCGMGNIGPASIGALAKDLRRRMMLPGADMRVDPANYTIGEIAEKARAFLFEQRYRALKPEPPAPHSLEFWIGGYSSNHEAGHEIWKISIVNGTCEAPTPVTTGGATGLFVGGQTAPVNRLVVGFDQGLFDALTESGMEAKLAQELVSFLRGRLEAQMLMPTMPVKDAIELADFMVDTTKRFFRFLPGADIVGGDTDIAVVTRFEGFKWIRRKHFYPANLNPLETDHV
jgi:hypothetical protein